MGKRVLVAEDDPVMRYMVAFLLRSSGFVPVVARDGRDAWQRACTSIPIDLVLTDQNMPRMNGIGLTRRLRGSVRHRATPILILTTEDSDEMRQAGLDAGATDWLLKPFDPVALVTAVSQALS